MQTEFKLLNICQIDDQHETLFHYINNLEHYISRTDQKFAIMHTIEDIEHWTLVHFSVEECIMELIQYPDLGSHRMQHAKFKKNLQDIKLKARQGVLADTDIQFFRNWLVHHIGTVDADYAKYYTTARDCIAEKQKM